MHTIICMHENTVHTRLTFKNHVAAKVSGVLMVTYTVSLPPQNRLYSLYKNKIKINATLV